MRPLDRAEALKRGDFGLAERVDRRHAGAHWLAVDQHRTGAALGKPAAELGGVETQIIAQHVEQWRVRLGRHTAHRAIHLDVDGHNWSLPTGHCGRTAPHLAPSLWPRRGANST